MNGNHRLARMVLLVLLLLLAAVFILPQLPFFQTFAIRKATELLESRTDAVINIGNLHFKPFNTIVIKDLDIIDRTPAVSREGTKGRDTLAHIGSLRASFSLFGLIGNIGGGIRMKGVKLRDSRLNLVIEDNELYSTNLQRIFRLVRKEGNKPMTDKEIINVKRVEIENFSFGMQNFKVGLKDIPETSINWSDLLVTGLNLEAGDFRIGGGYFSGKAEKLEFNEKSGWHVANLSATAKAGRGEVIIDDIRLDDGESTADLDFRMDGRSEAYSDYVNMVKMTADIRESRWSLRTLARFIPKLNPDPDTFIKADGHCEGTVADFLAKNLRVSVEGTDISVNVNGSLSGLPAVDKLKFDVDCEKMSFRTAEIGPLVSAIAPNVHADISKLGQGEVFSGDIALRGPINALNADIRIRQNDGGGTVSLKTKTRNILGKGRSRLSLTGTVRSEDFNLGNFLGTDRIGEVSLSADIRAALPAGDRPLEASVDSLKAETLEFNGCALHGITARAQLCGRDLDAKVEMRDSVIDASAVISSDINNYPIALSIRKADLKRLNIDKRELSVVHCNVDGSIGKDLQKLNGKIKISDIILTNGKGPHRTGDISITSSGDEEIYDIRIDSPMLRAKYRGKGKRMDVSFSAFDTMELLAFVLPGLYIESGTEGNALIDADGKLNGRLVSGRIAMNDSYIKNLSAEVEGSFEELYGTVTSDKVMLSGWGLDNSIINVSLKDKVMEACYIFDNKQNADELLNSGIVSAAVRFGDDSSKEITVLPSKVVFNGGTWHIPRSEATVSGKEINIDNFIIRNGGRMISIDGGISEKEEAVLSAQIKDLNLAALNHIFKEKKFGFRGLVNADARIFSPLVNGKMPFVDMKLRGDSLGMNGIDLGALRVESLYRYEDQSFSVKATDTIAGKEAMTIEGIYDLPSNSIQAEAGFNGFPIGFAQAFVPAVFSRMGGRINGHFNLEGPISRMDVSSRNASLKDGLLEVSFTHVPYKIDGPFSIDNNGISLEGVAAEDSYGNKGEIHGGLKWDHMKNLAMDMNMNVRGMQVLNIPANTKGALFYGNIFGTGNVGFSGPFKNLVMKADVRTAGNSDMHFSISREMNASSGSKLTFVNPNLIVGYDPYDEMMNRYRTERKMNASNFNIQMHAVATPSLKMSMDIGGGSFNALMNGTGNGDININLNTTSSDFSIFGDYIIQEGNFDVNANNIIHRNFKMEEGSSVKFNGDIMESMLDVSATYETKASISTLIADTTSVSNRRTVRCGVKITESLSEPYLKFKIDIPELDPSVQSQVESALNTDDKIQKQFLSLLISNNFLPDEQGGIVNNSSLLYSNVSEIMSNQINNIFTKLDIPLDVGLNYQLSDRGTNLFDVAISTQILDNRVIIGGSLGNRQKQNTGNDTFFGDIDIQYKVTRSGALRLKAFSHSADQYSNYLDNSQRNGIGLSWQQEFDYFVQWFKRLFRSRKEKEAYAAQETERNRKTKRILLNGKQDGNKK